MCYTININEENDMKYPNIEVKLSETDANAFAIVSKVKRTLKRNGVSKEELQEFIDEALSGDYDNVIQTCFRWVNVI